MNICVYKYCLLNDYHNILPFLQSLVQARKAGIASAMAARSSIKDEELVSSKKMRLRSRVSTIILFTLFSLLPEQNRKTTCTRKPFKRWSTQYHAPRHITLKCGPPQRPRIVMSVKGCCGELRDKASAAQSVVSSVTKSVRNCWMLTVCNVSMCTIGHFRFTFPYSQTF